MFSQPEFETTALMLTNATWGFDWNLTQMQNFLDVFRESAVSPSPDNKPRQWQSASITLLELQSHRCYSCVPFLQGDLGLPPTRGIPGWPCYSLGRTTPGMLCGGAITAEQRVQGEGFTMFSSLKIRKVFYSGPPGINRIRRSVFVLGNVEDFWDKNGQNCLVYLKMIKQRWNLMSYFF